MSALAGLGLGLVFGGLAGACAFVIAYHEYRRNWAFLGNAVHAALKTAAVTFLLFFIAILGALWAFERIAQ